MKKGKVGCNRAHFWDCVGFPLIVLCSWSIILIGYVGVVFLIPFYLIKDLAETSIAIYKTEVKNKEYVDPHLILSDLIHRAFGEK